MASRSPMKPSNAGRSASDFKVSLTIRNVSNDGTKEPVQKKVVATARTVDELKTYAKEKLQDSWKDFEANPEIHVFRIKSKKEQEIIFEEDGEQALKDRKEYFAVEIFFTVPIDLKRAIAFKEVAPAVFTHPDHQYKNKFTNVSPIHCAMMKDGQEQASPWWKGFAQQNKFSPNGVSLSCLGAVALSTAEKLSTNSAILSVGMEDFVAQCKKEGVEMSKIEDGIFGALNTSFTHIHNPNVGFKAKSDKTIITPAAWKKQDTNGKDRQRYFNYVLSKGQDLAEYGMAVVYDNFHEGHFTLVRTKQGKSYLNDWYRMSRNTDIPGIYLPREYIISNADKTFQTSSEWEEILKPVKVNEPMYFPMMTEVSKTHLAFPKVASLFTLEDFVLKGKAEPIPLDGDDDPPSAIQKLLYEACVVMTSRWMEDLDRVNDALRQLYTARYDLGEFDHYFLETLRSAMENTHEIINEETYEGIDNGKAIQTLVQAIEEIELVLSRQVDQADIPSPLLTRIRTSNASSPSSQGTADATTTTEDETMDDSSIPDLPSDPSGLSDIPSNPSDPSESSSLSLH